MGMETASVLTEGKTPSQLRDSGGLGRTLTALSSFCQPLRRWIRLAKYEVWVLLALQGVLFEALGCCSHGIHSEPMA